MASKKTWGGARRGAGRKPFERDKPRRPRTVREMRRHLRDLLRYFEDRPRELLRRMREELLLPDWVATCPRDKGHRLNWPSDALQRPVRCHQCAQAGRRSVLSWSLEKRGPLRPMLTTLDPARIAQRRARFKRRLGIEMVHPPLPGLIQRPTGGDRPEG